NYPESASEKQKTMKGSFTVKGRGGMCYGLQPKSLLNIPHRFFIAMTDELQFIQRNNINWFKAACMPSSATDKFTVDFESIGFFVKQAKYKFNQDLEQTVTYDLSVRDRDATKLNNTPGKTRSNGLVHNQYE